MSLRPEVENKDSVSARKVLKADREKLRRDRLNEQFIELGNELDPDRPKNCKATILADTIQTLKHLMVHVDKLKSEYSALVEEARELTQEKHDLREEKTSLKSDIEDLNVQYQQRLRSMYSWPAMNHPVVMAPSTYPIPVPIPMPPGPIPMHSLMQPYPFLGNQNPGMVPPIITPNTVMRQQSIQQPSPIVQPVIKSHNSGKRDSKSRSMDRREVSGDGNDAHSYGVATELELKTPGSTEYQGISSTQTSKKVPSKERRTSQSCSSRCSSAHSVQGSSSNSVVGGVNFDDDSKE